VRRGSFAQAFTTAIRTSSEGIPVWIDTTPLLTEDGKMLTLDAHNYLHAYVQPARVIHLPLVQR